MIYKKLASLGRRNESKNRESWEHRFSTFFSGPDVFAGGSGPETLKIANGRKNARVMMLMLERMPKNVATGNIYRF